MTSTQEHIIRLQATIQQQEQDILKLEADIAELNHELDEFEARYNKVVKGVADRVSALRDAIRDLEAVRRQERHGLDVSIDDLWREAKSRPESQPQDEIPHIHTDTSRKKPKIDPDLKALYRRLARRFHPDLASDEADLKNRNDLMAMINAAYENQDKDALMALEEAAPAEAAEVIDSRLPLDVLRLRQLQQHSADLAVKLQDLRVEHLELMHSPLMDMKLQEKMAYFRGRDYLQETADNLEKEYWELMKRLDALRAI